MDGGKSEQPAQPDWMSLARQQGQENRDTARWNASANRINEYTPFGSRVFTRTPSGGTTRQFDQTGYDAALKAFQAGGGGGGAPGVGMTPSDQVSGLDGYGGYETRSATNAAPRIEDFYRDIPNGEDTWSATTSLSPEQQSLHQKDIAMRNQYADIASAGLGKVGQNVGTPLDFSSLGEMRRDIDFSKLGELPGQYSATNLQSSIDDYSNDRQRVEAALMERMAPQQARDDEAMRQRLANQGITLGSEAYGAEARNANDARSRSRLDAILSAGQEQSRLQSDAVRRGQFANSARGQRFSEEQAQRQYALAARQQLAQEAQAQAAFSNQSRAQALQEILTRRQVPMNEINALRSGSQMTAPQFQAYNNNIMAQPANLYGAGQQGYQGQMNQYNAGVASDNAMMSGLFGLGSAAMTGGAGGLIGGLFGLGGDSRGSNRLGMLELMR